MISPRDHCSDKRAKSFPLEFGVTIIKSFRLVEGLLKALRQVRERGIYYQRMRTHGGYVPSYLGG
jgi:hypothetical protein